jgi:hypothetical protein
MSPLPFLLFIILATLLPCRAHALRDFGAAAIEEARENKPLTTIGGYVQFWFTREQMEDGSRQDVTGDKAVQESSGFSINRARIVLDGAADDVGGRISVRLEGGSAGVLDAYGYFAPFGPWLKLLAGQMKIPSTYESLQGDEELDFATRTKFSEEVANWSLSKSPSSVSPFTSIQTYQRDTGAAIRVETHGFSLYLMTGNGLGANLFIGGPEKKQFVYGNEFGAYFYGIRASVDIMKTLRDMTGITTPVGILSLGGHYDKNNHPNILYNDQKTVLDIKRTSWSVDAQVKVLDRLRLTGMYGKGSVDDDFDYDGKSDFVYSGWEFKAIAVILRDLLEAGIRYEEFRSEKSIYAGHSTAAAWTAGITLLHGDHLRLMANYKWKFMEGELAKELDDDIFILQMQYKF